VRQVGYLKGFCKNTVRTQNLHDEGIVYEGVN